MRVFPLLTLLATSILFSTQLHANESEGEWEFMIAPFFLWGMSIDGDAALEGNALPLDLSFSQATSRFS